LSDQSTRTETRERIVEAARQLFFQQGYGATGIAQILKESQANSGSLYHFFPTKEDLLVAVLEQYKAMLQTHVIGPAYERVDDPIERIFAVLDGYRRLLEATNYALGCPIGNLALEISNSHPLARRFVVENFENWRIAIRELIESASGRLPTDTDPDALSKLVLASMEGAVMLARAYRNFDAFDGTVHQLRDHFELLIKSGTEWVSAKPVD
jgi:TetR/AcrR family transcriptional regulator, transcriptional repressor for nem operon